MNSKKLENVKMSDKNKRLKKKTENNDNGNGEKDESWYYVQKLQATWYCRLM